MLVAGVLEHVERAGVHSGDAIFCLPPRHTAPAVQAQLIDAAGRLARTLAIRGPFNVQFLVKNEAYQIIELNLRASRSLPFLAKATGVPLLREAARAMLGRPISREGVAALPPGRWGVKVPQFSFLQLAGSDPLLGVEMQSTGEVACFGPTFSDALVKALVAAGVRLVPRRGTAFLSVGGPELKEQLLPVAHRLRTLGLKISATEDTGAFLAARGIRGVRILHKVSEPDRHPNVTEALDRGAIRPPPQRAALPDPGEVRADARGRVHPPPPSGRARDPALHEPRSVRRVRRRRRLARGPSAHGRAALRVARAGRGPRRGCPAAPGRAAATGVVGHARAEPVGPGARAFGPLRAGGGGPTRRKTYGSAGGSRNRWTHRAALSDLRSPRSTGGWEPCQSGSDARRAGATASPGSRGASSSPCLSRSSYTS